MNQDSGWECVQKQPLHLKNKNREWFENKVYPGIREMLTRLKDAGLTLAVATSKPEPFAIQILEHFDLLSYFTLVGGADMEEIRVAKAM